VRRFVVRTLGCKVNQYESQRLVEQLEAIGWCQCTNGDGAALCVVNTCTVTEEADAKSRQALRRLRREHPGALVVAAGCYAERDRAALAAVEGVDRVLDNAQKERLVEVLGLAAGCGARVPSGISRFAGHARAFIKVQDGCDRRCSYCIIPHVRGPSRSRPMAAVLDEARALVRNGYRELVLTGVHLGDYADNGRGLPELLGALDGVEGLMRVRLSSIEPEEVTAALVGAIAASRTACPHLHVPLQSGSNAVLARMNRRSTRETYLATVERATAAIPDLSISTDLMVGFPGETETEFAASLDVIGQVGFSKVHVFPFSPRAGTEAAARTDFVEHAVVKERLARVATVAGAAARRHRERFVGRVVEVLVEGRTKDGRFAHGFTPNYLRTLVEDAALEPGAAAAVRITSCDAAHLYGRAEGTP
jgi:threonylcarbamoyladenosine tRNA methylthiotransferase MtaB